MIAFLNRDNPSIMRVIIKKHYITLKNLLQATRTCSHKWELNFSKVKLEIILNSDKGQFSTFFHFTIGTNKMFIYPTRNINNWEKCVSIQ